MLQCSSGVFKESRMCYRVSLRCNTFWCDTGLRAFQGIPSLLQGVTGVFHGPRGGYRVLGMLQGYWDVTASYIS